jgi:alpha-2-macroglobulin-like protein
VVNKSEADVLLPIVDIGIPPGFYIDVFEFEKMVLDERISKYEKKGDQVILYLEKLEADSVETYIYTIKSRSISKVRTPKSEVYEYYTPENRAESESVILTVR